VDNLTHEICPPGLVYLLGFDLKPSGTFSPTLTTSAHVKLAVPAHTRDSVIAGKLIESLPINGLTM
jgi:hypothetical protein